MPRTNVSRSTFRLQDTDLKPFAFADPALEDAYRKATIEGTMERLKPSSMYFWWGYDWFLNVIVSKLWETGFRTKYSVL